ncbi:MAG TPA: PHP domain-containing protein, partial [Vicinamibacteria bacterium]
MAPGKGRRRRWILAGLLLVVAAAALRVALWKPRAVVGEAPRDGYTRAAGAVHVHTTLSDGGGGPEEVAAAARRAGLAFVALTDHNNVDAKPFEGYHEGVLVLVGSEISTTAGHLLALGIADPVYR